MKKYFLPLLAALLLACNATKEPQKASTPLNSGEELAAIEELRSEFSRAIKQGRYQDLGQWLSADAKTVRAAGGGWDTMYALGQERGRFPYDSIRMTPTETFILNDTMAYDWGTSKVYYTNEHGQAVELRDSYLVILKKENGKWKLHREVASSVVNP